MMAAYLDDSARVRLSNIRAVKPEKAEALENIIISNVQQGKVQGKINEDQVIDLLNQFAQKDAETTGSKVEFKRAAFDSDDDLDLDNLDL